MALVNSPYQMKGCALSLLAKSPSTPSIIVCYYRLLLRKVLYHFKEEPHRFVNNTRYLVGDSIPFCMHPQELGEGPEERRVADVKAFFLS